MDSLEPMQVDDPEVDPGPPSDFTVDSPTFDLDTYASSYTGLAKIKRLTFVARHCPSLRVDALKLALEAVEQTHCTSMFIDIRQRLQMASGDSKFSPDQEDAIAFVTTTSRKAAITLERLDSDLKNYRSNSIKESIRYVVWICKMIA